MYVTKPLISPPSHNTQTHTDPFAKFLVSRLSPPQRPLCVVGRLGERKRERARHDGKEEGRFPLPIVPRALSIFSIIAILMGIPSGSLCGGERSTVYYFQTLVVVAFAECQRKKKNLPTSPVLVPMFIKPFNFSCWGENFHYKHSLLLHFCHALGLKIALILLLRHFWTLN